ncbi:hypothetical protein [Arsenicicoccus sp. oral taxon 190]|uniref:hypothetical protein n=1 Tax=Arsenicicoccus sp. oral taxon 190 TaxID=1658671 RepID=UPI000679F383|nr:hypothetical protein [Arsenicicoccus sp. oral taxon 190]AKT50392.1 hypothetical protein ADJ73_01970 [Arsenicicoccus sp. oral taxon 190]
MRDSADRLQQWYAAGCAGPRPPGRLRPYVPPTLGRVERALGGVVYRYGDDPDGRPRALRGTDQF